MNYNDRDTWVYEARDAVTEFGARDIDLPERVTDAIAVMDRVAAAKPTKPSPTVIRERIIEGAAQNELDQLLLADATATRLASEWAQAYIDTAGGVLDFSNDKPRVIRGPAHLAACLVCRELLLQVTDRGSKVGQDSIQFIVNGDYAVFK